MQSTLKPRDSDPHDVFTISPDIVPAAWADKVLADINRDSVGVPPLRTPAVEPPSATSSVPSVERTSRATAAGDRRIPEIDVANERPAGPPPRGGRMKSAISVFLFALCSALAAASWQHYGAAARQMISAWIPPFALTSSLSTEPTGLAAKPDAPDVAAAAPAAQPAADDQAPQPAPSQATDAAAPATAPSADPEKLQSMARDLAAMGQEIVLLKASIAELKAAAAAKTPQAAPSQVNTSDLKPSLPNPKPKIAAPPPRPLAAQAPRRPMQPYPSQTYSTQGYPAQPYPSAQAAGPQPLQPYPAVRQPAPPPPMAADADDGEPVVRPPMPLH
jgi:hypothetical protein